jgi:hypothetical protein
MKRRRARRSALQDRRDAGLGGLSLLLPAISVSLRTKEEDTLAVYCPVIEARCGEMECRGCPNLEEEVPNQAWLCSACSEDFQVLPHWGEGDCESCGDHSSFLLLVPT